MSYPLVMQAPVKDYIWGGTKLRDKYSKVSSAEKLAESMPYRHISGIGKANTHLFGSKKHICLRVLI